MRNRADQIAAGSGLKRNNLLGEGRFAIGLAIGVFLSLVCFMYLDLAGMELTKDEWLAFLPAFAALIVALASLVLSYSALSEQRRMRQAGTDPVVLVHLGKRDDALMLITFEIRNVGAGAAMNVEIEVDPVVSGFNPDRVITDLSQLTHPIKTIPQNHSVSFNFGMGFRLLGEDGEPPLPPFDVKVRYADIEGTKYESTYTIDVRELELQQAHKLPMSVIADGIKELSESVRRSSNGIAPLHVRTESRLEYEHGQRSVAIAALKKSEGL